MRCELCREFGADREADAIATIPMCGQEPRYALCAAHLADVGAYVADVQGDT